MSRKRNEEKTERLEIVNISFWFIFYIAFISVFIYYFDFDVWLNNMNGAKVKLPVLERIANMWTDRLPFKHFPFLLPSQSYQ